MSFQVTQEFKSNKVVGELDTRVGSTFVWESPRLTTAYPIPGKPKGSDRAICSTVNGILKVDVLENKDLLLGNYQGVLVTAGLWGEYNRVPGVLASVQYFLDDNYANYFVSTPPITAIFSTAPSIGWGVPLFNNNGGLGFNTFTSFSNHAQNIYIKLVFTRQPKDLGLAINYKKIPIRIQCSGLLKAAQN
jgi:hypothetical protein